MYCIIYRCGFGGTKYLSFFNIDAETENGYFFTDKNTFMMNTSNNKKSIRLYLKQRSRLRSLLNILNLFVRHLKTCILIIRDLIDLCRLVIWNALNATKGINLIASI